MLAKVVGEFMGTLMLVLLGNGVVSSVLLRKSKAEGAGWLAIVAGWAFAVVFGVFTAVACGSPDAHLNPAVTVGLAVVSGDYSKVAFYLPVARHHLYAIAVAIAAGEATLVDRGSRDS